MHVHRASHPPGTRPLSLVDDLEIRIRGDIGEIFLAHDETDMVETPTLAVARPTLSVDPWATPIRGVYLCSASTPPGGESTEGAASTRHDRCCVVPFCDARYYGTVVIRITERVGAGQPGGIEVVGGVVGGIVVLATEAPTVVDGIRSEVDGDGDGATVVVE